MYSHFELFSWPSSKPLWKPSRKAFVAVLVPQMEPLPARWRPCSLCCPAHVPARWRPQAKSKGHQRSPCCLLVCWRCSLLRFKRSCRSCGTSRCTSPGQARLLGPKKQNLSTWCNAFWRSMLGRHRSSPALWHRSHRRTDRWQFRAPAAMGAGRASCPWSLWLTGLWL